MTKDVSETFLDDPTPLPYNEPRALTSTLLSDAAQLIHDLMIGRGVDRRNGFDWEAFVRDLRDRAAAFKSFEDEGRS